MRGFSKRSSPSDTNDLLGENLQGVVDGHWCVEWLGEQAQFRAGQHHAAGTVLDEVRERGLQFRRRFANLGVGLELPDQCENRFLVGGEADRQAALLAGTRVEAGLAHGGGGQQPDFPDAGLRGLDVVEGERDQVQHGNLHGVRDVFEIVVRGIARDHERLGPCRFQALRDGGEGRAGVDAAALEQRRDARGDVRVVVDDQVDVVGIVSRRCGFDHAAHELAESVLSAESEFQGKIYAPDEAVRYAMGSTLKPVVIADTQDNPGAGGNSDTIGMLRALIDAGANSSVIGLIYDPESAQLAHQAGEGKEIEISLGARSRWDGEAPFKSVFRVQSIGDGRITGTGPMFGGARMELGPMAALKIGGIEVLVSSKKMQLADQAIFHHLKIEPSTRAILVLKSSVHFRADFSGLAGEIIIAASPGPNAADNLALPFQNVRPTVRLAPGGPTLEVR